MDSRTESFPSGVNRAKTVVIVGASGYIGRHLVAELRRLGGYRIKLLSRSLGQDLSGAGSGVEVFKGDLRAPETLRGLFESDCIVINLAYLWEAGEAANLEVTANLLEACKSAKIKRLIHCSTAAVVGRTSVNRITEDTICCPVTEYGITKLKVEQAIIKEGQGRFDVAILRPTSVFGPGGNPLKKLARDVISGNRLKNYLKSCLFGARRMNLVTINKVVGAIIFLMCHEEDLGGNIFIVSDDDSPMNNFADVEKFLMKEFQIPDYAMPRVSLPLGLLEFLLRVMGRNSVNPRCDFDSGKLRKLGFKSPRSLSDGLAEYASWYRMSHLGAREPKVS